MIDFSKIFSKNKEASVLEKEKLAKILRTNPAALEAFEQAYRVEIMSSVPGENLNAKQMADQRERCDLSNLQSMIDQIVDELVSETVVYRYEHGEAIAYAFPPLLTDKEPITKDMILEIPEDYRPELTGSLMKMDFKANPSTVLLYTYDRYKHAATQKEKMLGYHIFRQGLDIQDLDAIMYQIIDTNRTSMGHWFPALVEATKKQSYFKVPNTTIIKVPLPLLQLTRLEYQEHTQTTLEIVDKYCQKVFNLDENRDYFIRTGTSSSKYDFRNAKVTGAKEVKELGEYLLYNHHSGLRLAGSLNGKVIYGMQTTVEWAVREFIQDRDNNPQIYFGLPLRTEFRLFIDMDAPNPHGGNGKILGISPYWKPDVMKKRFSMENDFRNPDKIHDYTIYAMHEPVLMERYEKYKEKVTEKMEDLLPYLHLTGQWSIDVMFNGLDENGNEDMYIIDMAIASDSALIECVPEKERKKILASKLEEDWIPTLEAPKFYIEKTGGK